ncbi:MAG TPA: hypothetical protein VF551_05930 [Chthoniobacterales bacterium]
MLAGFVGSARAQAPISQNVDRAQLLRNQPPTLRDSPATAATDEDQAPASPNDPDLGEQAILKRADQYQPFTVATSAPISYTSNVALVRSGEEDDILFTPSVSVAYAPRITKTLYGTFSVGQQVFYYDRFDELDFGSFDVRAGLAYTLPQLRNLVLRADYAYNRLTDDDYDEFYSSHSLNFGGEIPFRIGRAQQISAGADFSFNLDSDPDGPGRHDYSGFVSYSVSLTRAFSMSAVARLAVRDYVESDRLDVSGIFALSANYRFTRWLSASAISTFATSNSNRDVFDYDVANVGAALALNFRF